MNNFLSNALLCLLPRRDDWNALCADPALISNALKEALRIELPQTSWRRVTNVDSSIAGVSIPAGTQVFLSLGAANHQPSLFEVATHPTHTLPISIAQQITRCRVKKKASIICCAVH